MLEEQERREIEEELKHFENRAAGSVEALKVVQRHHGWVSDEHLGDVATLLGLTSADLDGVATFYNLIFRRPVGRHVILLCDSVSCWIMGYETVRDVVSARLGIRLGETTADGQVTLLPIVCLGACDHAPAMMLDGQLYGDLTPEKIDALLAEVRQEFGAG